MCGNVCVAMHMAEHQAVRLCLLRGTDRPAARSQGPSCPGSGRRRRGRRPRIAGSIPAASGTRRPPFGFPPVSSAERAVSPFVPIARPPRDAAAASAAAPRVHGGAAARRQRQIWKGFVRSCPGTQWNACAWLLASAATATETHLLRASWHGVRGQDSLNHQNLCGSWGPGSRGAARIRAARSTNPLRVPCLQSLSG